LPGIAVLLERNIVVKKQDIKRREQMKSWMNRFALLAVLGAVIGSAVVVGCGPSEPEDAGNAPANTPAAGGATEED
jgi:hypothetical protein